MRGCARRVSYVVPSHHRSHRSDRRLHHRVMHRVLEVGCVLVGILMPRLMSDNKAPFDSDSDTIRCGDARLRTAGPVDAFVREPCPSKVGATPARRRCRCTVSITAHRSRLGFIARSVGDGRRCLPRAQPQQHLVRAPSHRMLQIVIEHRPDVDGEGDLDEYSTVWYSKVQYSSCWS